MVLVILATLASPVAGQSDLEALYSLTLNFTPKDPSWSGPACQWKGVECNATGGVFAIAWDSQREVESLSGYPNFTMLPQGLQVLRLETNQMTGTPNFVTLPQGLQVLDLSRNQLTGTPNLTALPQGLQQLGLETNQFTGSGFFFSGRDVWCTVGMSHASSMLGMCGVGYDGIFNCTAGVWQCASAAPSPSSFGSDGLAGGAIAAVVIGVFVLVLILAYCVRVQKSHPYVRVPDLPPYHTIRG